MKLPDVFSGLLGKSEETKEYYFSLYLDADAAAVAVWSLTNGSPKVGSFAHALVAEDSWEARTHVIDRLLSAAEDKVGVTKAITKTVFGLPGAYLTPEGNIRDEVRPHLKKLTKMLELTPVGFVPLSSAIAFSLKKDEGVPPSAILVGCAATHAQITLYRVGQVTHEDVIDVGDPAAALEATLKKHQDGDVLPSRMLLYGGNTSLLEELRSKLLKHPWPTRTNFLHFPKIELVTLESLLTSVSLAGASELTPGLGEGEDAGVAETVVAQATRPGAPSAAVPQDVAPDDEGEDISPSAPDEEEETEEIDGEMVEGEEEMVGDDTQEDGNEEVPEDEIPGEESGVVMAKNDADEIENIQMVTPESLGFTGEDVLEHVASPRSKEAPVKSEKAPKSLSAKFSMPKFSMPSIPNASALAGRLPKLKGGLPVIIGGIVLIGILAGLFYALPRVTVTVLVASQSLDESTTLTVDTESVAADSESKSIPGKRVEQSVSGEKTITVSGKKNIGDPAKGAVTIYNKVTTGRTLSKGTVLTASGVSFTLDSDVSVASASESIGSITFGKATANVTARDIGPNGNLPASSEFTFANVNGSAVSARNESAFTGGTSKQVTVVSRADQDSLVKSLTEELVAKAKEQLKSATAGEILIDQTVKTEVSEKVFDAELDEEAKSLNGKVTIKVTGTSVSDSDAKAALMPLVERKVPAGYTLAPEQTNVTTSNVTVKKDGTITLSAKLTAIALPVIDGDAIKGKLTGQSVDKASAILKETPGVAAAEYRFSLTPFQTNLPLNKGNITISIAVQ